MQGHEGFIRNIGCWRDKFVGAENHEARYELICDFLNEFVFNGDNPPKLDKVKWFLHGGYGHDSERLFEFHQYFSPEAISAYREKIEGNVAALADFDILFCDDPEDIAQLKFLA